MPRLPLCLLTLVALLGCASGDDSAPSSRQGAVRISLVDAPAPTLKALRIRVERVEIHASDRPGASGWVVLGEPKKTVDLLTLTNGLVETLVPGATLETGRYQQLRLVLGTPNELVLADDRVVPLEVPSALASGLKVPLSFEVQPGTTRDIFIDFDAARSIQVHETGSSTRFILRPVIRAVDRAVTGSISGTLAGPAGPLAEAPVFGQTTVSGRQQVLRTVRTQADGRYVLDLLPMDTPVLLASLSAGVTPRGSDLITLTASQPTGTWSGAFTAASGSGLLTGSVAPAAAASEADVAEILTQVPSGGTLRWAIVAVVPVVSGAAVPFQASLPPGTYQVQVRRTTVQPDGTLTSTLSPLTPSVSLTAGATVTLTAAF